MPFGHAGQAPGTEERVFVRNISKLCVLSASAVNSLLLSFLLPKTTTNTSDDHYCVLTATLVEPRVMAPESLKRTKILFVAGSKGTLPPPATKIPNVGVALALIVVVTVLDGGAKQAPVVEFV